MKRRDFCKALGLSAVGGMLLTAGFTITDRRYIAHEDDTGYHHYAIDVAKEYEQEEI